MNLEKKSEDLVKKKNFFYSEYLKFNLQKKEIWKIEDKDYLIKTLNINETKQNSRLIYKIISQFLKNWLYRKVIK